MHYKLCEFTHANTSIREMKTKMDNFVGGIQTQSRRSGASLVVIDRE